MKYSQQVSGGAPAGAGSLDGPFSLNEAASIQDLKIEIIRRNYSTLESVASGKMPASPLRNVFTSALFARQYKACRVVRSF